MTETIGRLGPLEWRDSIEDAGPQQQMEALALEEAAHG